MIAFFISIAFQINAFNVFTNTYSPAIIDKVRLPKPVQPAIKQTT
ncbi:MAG: hypothetical protein OFPII_10430 [Osedax symbiont Rs1]|nr:MAG: hypothetical protein OFPII_10430 [Osedax symbiont Rs1]